MLGQFWVLRELRLRVDVEYPAGIDRADFERSYSEWVPARELAALNTGEFAGLMTPPATDFVSRWVAPVAVSAGLGVIIFLFFSVR